MIFDPLMKDADSADRPIAGQPDDLIRSSPRAAVLRLPRDVVSVCGCASVGKKTLIQKLTDGMLRDRFGIDGAVEAYGEDFRPLDEIHAPYSEFVLFQWQTRLDTVIEELRSGFPASTHRVILIWRPWEEHLRDWLGRYWRGEYPGMVNEPSLAALAQKWIDDIVPRFRDELPAKGIPVELVDGSTPTYDRLEWQAVDRSLTIAAEPSAI